MSATDVDVDADKPSKAAQAQAQAQAQEQETPAARLTELQAKATAEYAVKHYREAAELYSQATELQAEINGEMAVENADLLYAYGKCLYYLAQQTSSVLGGEAAAAQLKASKDIRESKEPKKVAKKRKLNDSSQSLTLTETNGKSAELGTIAEKEDQESAENGIEELTSTSTSDKPYFRIEGDAAGWNSEDEDEDEDDEDDDNDEKEEEQDDFSDAYEMLDIARVLYLRKLGQLEESEGEKEADEAEDKGKGKSKGKEGAGTVTGQSDAKTSPIQEIKSRIADIHDLQAEVLLEGEKYSAAVEDLEKCLALKKDLLPAESSLLAECHFKLSLALEFASQSQERDSLGNPTGNGDIVIDWDIRNKAIEHQQAAIDSCKLRVERETQALAALEEYQTKTEGNGEGEGEGEKDDKEKEKAKEEKKAEIADVQDMIAEMEQHLADLRKPPINIKEETTTKFERELLASAGAGAGAGAAASSSTGAGSVLGNILGASQEEQTAILAKVAAGASDITGLVKRKNKNNKRKAEEEIINQEDKAKANGNGNGNGKATATADDDGASTASAAKKAKIQEDS